MKILIIKDKLILDEKMKANEFMVYLGLLMLLKKNETLYYVNVKLLAYLLTKKYPSNGNLDKNILSGIEGLASSKMISYVNIVDDSNKKIEQNGKDEWLLDLTKLIELNQKKENDFYTAIDEKYIYKILLYNEKYYTRSITLLKFHAYVLSTMFKTGANKGVGFTSLKSMADDTGYSTKTISSYLDLLVELQIVYIYKSKDFIKFETGEFAEISHTYGRYSDMELVNQIGIKHEQDYGNKLKGKHKKIKKPNNKVRSYVQKYAYFKKSILETGVIPYKDGELEEIYRFMKKLNKQQKHKKNPYSLDVFSNFDFYQEDI